MSRLGDLYKAMETLRKEDPKVQILHFRKL